MSELRYQSTGKPVSVVQDDAAVEQARLANANNPRAARERALAEISGRADEAMQVDHDKKFKEAISRFEYRHPDFSGKQGMLLRVAIEANEMIAKAGRSGEVVHDWDSSFDKIADRVRANAGVPSASDQMRSEALAGMRSARGQTSG